MPVFLSPAAFSLVFLSLAFLSVDLESLPLSPNCLATQSGSSFPSIVTLKTKDWIEPPQARPAWPESKPSVNFGDFDVSLVFLFAW